jgi:hypothetical protein
MPLTSESGGAEPALHPPSALDMDDVVEPAGRTPLQALASAYADRLAAIRARADAAELADVGERIAVLERICLHDGGRRPFGGADAR